MFPKLSREKVVAVTLSDYRRQLWWWSNSMVSLLADELFCFTNLGEMLGPLCVAKLMPQTP